MTSDLRTDVTQFFDSFVAAFSTFDGEVIAQRYFPTFIALRTDGTLDSFTSSADIARYFQQFLDGYRADGCVSCSYKTLDVVSIGQACVLATVTWDLYDSNGAIVSSWRESYNLAYAQSGLRVFASIDHHA
jgi:hypothetical protein